MTDSTPETDSKHASAPSGGATPPAEKATGSLHPPKAVETGRKVKVRTATGKAGRKPEAGSDQGDDAPEENAKGKKSGQRGIWRGTIRPILEVILVVFLVRALIVDWNDVPSGSMKPTIQIGDRIMVNRLAYGLNIPIPFLRHNGEGKGFLDLPFTNTNIGIPIPGQPIKWGSPQRGDIVIVWSPQETVYNAAGRVTAGPVGTRLVKRLVAVPGDTIEVRSGVLIINGEAAEYESLDETYLDREISQMAPTAMELYIETLLEDERTVQMPEIVTAGGRMNNEIAVKAGVDSLAWNMEPRTLGDEEYFCVGDNRYRSNDCRVFGPVHRDQIVGEAFIIAMSFEGRVRDLSLRPNWGRFFKKLK